VDYNPRAGNPWRDALLQASFFVFVPSSLPGLQRQCESTFGRLLDRFSGDHIGFLDLSGGMETLRLEDFGDGWPSQSSSP